MNGENVHPALTRITSFTPTLERFGDSGAWGVFQTRYEPTPRISEFSISRDHAAKKALFGNNLKKG
jgi:hypothetical protein